MYKFIAFSLLIASALAVPAPDSVIARTENSLNLDCLEHDEDILSCLAVKATSALNRAARSADVKIIDGITFVRDTPMERSGKSLKPETEMLNELPRDVADRTIELAAALLESAVSFLKSHSLKVNVPEGSLSRALIEGRATKLKKMILPLIAAVGIKIFALVPILLGGLALLVVKALFVGKIALLIAGILAFQRLFNGGSVGSIGGGFGNIGGNIFGKNPSSSYYDSNQGWTSGVSANQGQGYYRSFSDKADAHTLAYSAHEPNSNEEN